MPKQYVPVMKTVELHPNDSGLPALTYWDGDMGLTDAMLIVTNDDDKAYSLPGLYLCSEEEQPDPEATALERIATALERIAEAMEAGSVGGANHTLSYFASADALIASLQPGG